MFWVKRVEQPFNLRWWHWPRRTRHVWGVAAAYLARMKPGTAQPSATKLEVPRAVGTCWTPQRPTLRSGAVAHLRYPNVPSDRQLLQVGLGTHLSDWWTVAPGLPLTSEEPEGVHVSQATTYQRPMTS